MFGSTIGFANPAMAFVAVAVVCGTLPACSLRGPTFAPASHVAYNEAVQQGQQRELLLNIVRLRYLDRVEFLAITSISSQMHFEARAALGGSFGDDQELSTNIVVPGASLAYSESPTVIFAPQAGGQFVRQLVSPIGVDSIYLLTHYGWSLDRTLRLIAEDVNGIRNIAPREGMTSDDIEESRRFDAMTEAMQSLYERRLIEIEVVERWTTISERIPAAQVSADDLLKAAAEGYRFRYDADDQTYTLENRVKRYVARVSPSAVGSQEADFLAARLGMRLGQGSYDIDTALSPESAPGSAITVKMRSVLATMAYLARGVEIPESDPLYSVLGSRSLDAVFRVVSSDEAPASSLLAVPYRGRWFHIEENDVESMRTLGLLTYLLRLEIGAGGSQNVPVLTLPLSR